MYEKLSDNELFDLVTQKRTKGEDVSRPLGELVERWRRPAAVVVRRVQASYRAGAPDDEQEIFQEAVRKLVERGLDQFRGISEAKPGAAASPKTFFLRIVKHAAIDLYRRNRELLEQSKKDGDEEAMEHTPGEIARATHLADRARERDEATGLYWTAFERLQSEHPNEAAAWDAYHHQDMEDHEACAKHLGITVANSYKRVSRAQAYLRRYLLELYPRANDVAESGDAMSPQQQIGYTRRLDELKIAIEKGDVGGALIAAGDVLRRTKALGVSMQTVKDALSSLDSKKVNDWVSSLDADAIHARLDRGLEDAFEVILADEPAERAEWVKEATKAILERDGLESARVACECCRSGRIETLDAKIAAVDAGLAKKAICLVGLNDFRRDELSQLDTDAQNGAWWFAARCQADALGDVIAGRKPLDPALVTDPDDRTLIQRLAGMDVPPKRVDGESLWMKEIGAASQERAKWAERHLDSKDKKAVDTDVE